MLGVRYALFSIRRCTQRTSVNYGYFQKAPVWGAMPISRSCVIRLTAWWVHYWNMSVHRGMCECGMYYGLSWWPKDEWKLDCEAKKEEKWGLRHSLVWLCLVPNGLWWNGGTQWEGDGVAREKEGVEETRMLLDVQTNRRKGEEKKKKELVMVHITCTAQYKCKVLHVLCLQKGRSINFKTLKTWIIGLSRVLYFSAFTKCFNNTVCHFQYGKLCFCLEVWGPRKITSCFLPAFSDLAHCIYVLYLTYCAACTYCSIRFPFILPLSTVVPPFHLFQLYYTYLFSQGKCKKTLISGDATN